MLTVEAVKTDGQRQQLEHILREHANGQLYLDIWKLGVNVALRISDLLALTMEQCRAIDPHRLQLTITEQKTKKTRVLTLNAGAIEVINRRVRDYPGDIWLFQSPLPIKHRQQAKPASRRSVALAFSNAGKRITPRVNMSTHSMRKTRGYAMHKAGASLETIAETLNHSHPAVTMRYIGLTADDIAQGFHDLVL